MKKSVFLGTLAVAGLAAGIASGQTLADVQARGTLNCGVSTGLTGFAAPDASGEWQGFDVAVCRAVATAVLGDPTAVEFVPTTGQTRFTALASGEVDMLARNTTWTFSRDVDLAFEFVGVNYYDGQGFMVPRDLGVSSAMELDGATVCIQTGTTTELNLADFFASNGMSYEPVPIETNAEAQQQYLAGACDVYTTDASGLAATRATFEDPAAHVVLPEIVSKEPLGPLVRHGDNEWGDIVRWTLNLLISAEELGITSANVAELAAGTEQPRDQPYARHRGQPRRDAGPVG
jgi:general L-amino acid transport system substrate-binding protein